jgi:hypothetical protein
MNNIKMLTNKTEILNSICYTELVYDRINKKLRSNFFRQEIETLIMDAVDEAPIECFEKIGKNYYVTNAERGLRITINSYTYRVITVDKM